MRGEWPVWSNLFFVLPAAVAAYCAVKLRCSGAMWARFGTLVVLAVVSSYYHACAADDAACSHEADVRLRQADHTLAIFATASLLVMFVPFLPEDELLELALQFLALGAAAGVAFGTNLDGTYADVWAALVVAVAWLVACLLAARKGFRVIQHLKCLLRRSSWALHVLRVAALLALAGAAFLWLYPDTADDSFAHAFWHVLTAVTAAALFYLLAEPRLHPDGSTAYCQM